MFKKLVCLFLLISAISLVGCGGGGGGGNPLAPAETDMKTVLLNLDYDRATEAASLRNSSADVTTKMGISNVLVCGQKAEKRSESLWAVNLSGADLAGKITIEFKADDTNYYICLPKTGKGASKIIEDAAKKAGISPVICIEYGDNSYIIKAVNLSTDQLKDKTAIDDLVADLNKNITETKSFKTEYKTDITAEEKKAADETAAQEEKDAKKPVYIVELPERDGKEQQYEYQDIKIFGAVPEKITLKDPGFGDDIYYRVSIDPETISKTDLEITYTDPEELDPSGKLYLYDKVYINITGKAAERIRANSQRPEVSTFIEIEGKMNSDSKNMAVNVGVCNISAQAADSIRNGTSSDAAENLMTNAFKAGEWDANQVLTCAAGYKDTKSYEQLKAEAANNKVNESKVTIIFDSPTNTEQDGAPKLERLYRYEATIDSYFTIPISAIQNDFSFRFETRKGLQNFYLSEIDKITFNELIKKGYTYISITITKNGPEEVTVYEISKANAEAFTSARSFSDIKASFEKIKAECSNQSGSKFVFIR